MEFLPGKFLVKKNGQRVPAATALEGKEVIGFYLAASWCPACEFFTRILRNFYDALRADNAAFEIIYVPLDKTEASFNDFFQSLHGDWYSIPFGDEVIPNIRNFFGAILIPHLTMVDSYGVLLTAGGILDIRNHGLEAWDRWSSRIGQPPARVLNRDCNNNNDSGDVGNVIPAWDENLSLEPSQRMMASGSNSTMDRKSDSATIRRASSTDYSYLDNHDSPGRAWEDYEKDEQIEDSGVVNSAVSETLSKNELLSTADTQTLLHYQLNPILRQIPQHKATTSGSGSRTVKHSLTESSSIHTVGYSGVSPNPPFQQHSKLLESMSNHNLKSTPYFSTSIPCSRDFGFRGHTGTPTSCQENNCAYDHDAVDLSMAVPATFLCPKTESECIKIFPELYLPMKPNWSPSAVAEAKEVEEMEATSPPKSIVPLAPTFGGKKHWSVHTPNVKNVGQIRTMDVLPLAEASSCQDGCSLLLQQSKQSQYSPLANWLDEKINANLAYLAENEQMPITPTRKKEKPQYPIIMPVSTQTQTSNLNVRASEPSASTKSVVSSQMGVSDSRTSTRMFLIPCTRQMIQILTHINASKSHEPAAVKGFPAESAPPAKAVNFLTEKPQDFSTYTEPQRQPDDKPKSIFKGKNKSSCQEISSSCDGVDPKKYRLGCRESSGSVSHDRSHWQQPACRDSDWSPFTSNSQDSSSNKQAKTIYTDDVSNSQPNLSIAREDRMTVSWNRFSDFPVDYRSDKSNNNDDISKRCCGAKKSEPAGNIVDPEFTSSSVESVPGCCSSRGSDVQLAVSIDSFLDTYDRKVKELRNFYPVTLPDPRYKKHSVRIKRSEDQYFLKSRKSNDLSPSSSVPKQSSTDVSLPLRRVSQRHQKLMVHPDENKMRRPQGSDKQHVGIQLKQSLDNKRRPDEEDEPERNPKPEQISNPKHEQDDPVRNRHHHRRIKTGIHHGHTITASNLSPRKRKSSKKAVTRIYPKPGEPRPEMKSTSLGNAVNKYCCKQVFESPDGAEQGVRDSNPWEHRKSLIDCLRNAEKFLDGQERNRCPFTQRPHQPPQQHTQVKSDVQSPVHLFGLEEIIINQCGNEPEVKITTRSSPGSDIHFHTWKIPLDTAFENLDLGVPGINLVRDSQHRADSTNPAIMIELSTPSPGVNSLQAAGTSCNLPDMRDSCVKTSSVLDECRRARESASSNDSRISAERAHLPRAQITPSVSRDPVSHLDEPHPSEESFQRKRNARVPPHLQTLIDTWVECDGRPEETPNDNSSSSSPATGFLPIRFIKSMRNLFMQWKG